MDLKLPAGSYVVAVSGGVDSMVLLKLLQKTGVTLYVAHVNHGIRDDSDQDEKLVQNYCNINDLNFKSWQLKLGKVSEDAARRARYKILRDYAGQVKATAIVTAHHMDDLIETAAINIIRGTGWRGIAPFVGASDILRPLLTFTKQQIVSYAKQNNVVWREDSTNTDQNYLRNFVRHSVLPRASRIDSDFTETFLSYIKKQQKLRADIERELRDVLDTFAHKTENGVSIGRYHLIMSDFKISYELTQQLLKCYVGRTLERALAERLIIFARAARPGKIMPLGSNLQARVSINRLIVETA